MQRGRHHTAKTSEILDEYDRVFAAVVIQAIADYEAARDRVLLHPSAGEKNSQDARAFLDALGLLSDAGDVQLTEQSII